MRDAEMDEAILTLARRLPMGWTVHAAARRPADQMLCVEVCGIAEIEGTCPCSEPDCAGKGKIPMPATISAQGATPAELVNLTMARVLMDAAPGGRA